MYLALPQIYSSAVTKLVWEVIVKVLGLLVGKHLRVNFPVLFPAHAYIGNSTFVKGFKPFGKAGKSYPALPPEILSSLRVPLYSNSTSCALYLYCKSIPSLLVPSVFQSLHFKVESRTEYKTYLKEHLFKVLFSCALSIKEGKMKRIRARPNHNHPTDQKRGGKQWH